MPDIPGDGAVDMLSYKPSCPGRYVLSTTIRRDIRGLPTAPVPRLFDEACRHMRVRHYSVRTEKIDIGWITRFILANTKRHPREAGRAEVEAFLSLLAVEGKVAARAQNQALLALLFYSVWSQELSCRGWKAPCAPGDLSVCQRHYHKGKCNACWLIGKAGRSSWQACPVAPACA